MTALMASTEDLMDRVSAQDQVAQERRTRQVELTAQALARFTGQEFLTQKFGGRTPSKYQASIFDWFVNGEGDAFVDAVAGSGKTTTLEILASLLPHSERRSAICLAFNAHITKELGDKLRKYGVQAQSIHSVGKRAVKDYYKSRGIGATWDAHTGEVLKHKYEEHCRAYIKANKPKGDDKGEVSDCLTKVVSMAIVTLTDPNSKPALREMIAHFDIDMVHEEYVLDAVPIVVGWGINGLPSERFTDTVHPKNGISYTDMVYLPNVLPGFNTLPKYKYIFVDEAQDLNAAQRELVLGMRAPGGRIVFVGDISQAIYGFSGADVKSVETIQRKTNALMLPLSVCYRCPASHIRLAQALVPHIEARPNAPEGTVLNVGRDKITQMAQEGDLFLCRTTAPLVKACLEMIAAGKQAKVRGKDIGEALVRVVDNVEKMEEWGTIYEVSEEKKVKLDFAHFLDGLALYERRAREVLEQKKDSQMQVESLLDRCDCVDTIYSSTLSKGLIRTLDDLRRQIESIFVEQKAHPPIMLSTVHKAKGLECQNVYLLRPELMPHPKAKEGWELDQEWNIKYISLTRSTDTLIFVHEDGAPEEEDTTLPGTTETPSTVKLETPSSINWIEAPSGSWKQSFPADHRSALQPVAAPLISLPEPPSHQWPTPVEEYDWRTRSDDPFAEDEEVVLPATPLSSFRLPPGVISPGAEDPSPAVTWTPVRSDPMTRRQAAVVPAPPSDAAPVMEEPAERMVELRGSVKLQVNHLFAQVPNGTEAEMLKAATAMARDPKRLAELLAEGKLVLEMSEMQFTWSGWKEIY